MPVTNIDFEGTRDIKDDSTLVPNTSTDDKTTIVDNDKDSLDVHDTDDITNKDNNIDSNDNKDPNNVDEHTSTGELSAGDTIELDGINYVVTENGDIVDEKGNIFKESKDVKEWLKSFEIDNDDVEDSLTIDSIQKELGVTVTDENGKPIEFTNDAKGIKSYVDSVISLRSSELQEAAINRLYQDNPLLKQFQDYVQLTGSPRGFGEIPDRSGIELDKNNENQLIAVIKMAAHEFGNKSLNDNYINYLKDSGGLYDEAEAQLKALVEKDEAYRKEIETKAQEQREEQLKDLSNYWNNVKQIIDSRQIGKYRIPESFTKISNGKKVVVTSKDFYNYISFPRESENGTKVTDYQKALNSLTDEEYLNREILDAWLMFTGGTYKDLVDMAIKEEKVRQLRVKSKNRSSSNTVKIIKSSASKSSIDDIIL